MRTAASPEPGEGKVGRKSAWKGGRRSYIDRKRGTMFKGQDGDQECVGGGGGGTEHEGRV